jgi:phage terminase small subunit
MSQRGPKLKTAKNSSQKPPRTISIGRVKPISTLDENGLAEFRRLVKALDNRGALDVADVGIITAAARAFSMVVSLVLQLSLPRPPRGIVAQVSIAENLYLGRLRALGFPIQPSRLVVKTVAKNKETAEAISGKIKLHA